MDSDGECERTEVQCTAWTEFGGGVLAVLGIAVFLLILVRGLISRDFEWAVRVFALRGQITLTLRGQIAVIQAL